MKMMSLSWTFYLPKKSIIVNKEEMAHLLKEKNHVMQWV
jgi:hypothetical protein